MIFDTLNIADCIIPPSDAPVAPPVLDQRCLDADFAAANPTVCSSAAYLVIKPSVVLVCKLGSIEFKVFLYQNGVEAEVTDGITFTSSDEDVLAIGVHTGSATGLAEGDVNLTVSRNGLIARAVVTVLSDTTCCDAVHVKTSILIDNSKSMGLAFGGSYLSRLAFARAAALDYSAKILMADGTPKDSIKVWSFTDLVSEVSTDFLTDTTELASEINGITQTQQKTDLEAILLAAVNDMIAATADEKVILLVSDGEQTSTANVQPILDTAATFKALGGIIVVVGLRASGNGYDLLSRIATGGFFLNAMAGNSNDVLSKLDYLKSILCSGICASAGDDYVNTPTLDYSSFLNWEVLSGQVNLIGSGFLDLQPGNGLYVDMMGGTAGTIRSIDTFSLVAGLSYRISFRAAGNNRLNTPGANQTLLVSVIDATTSAQIFGHVVVPAWDDAFTSFAFTFTADSAADVKLVFQQLYNTAFAGEWHGDLLDSIKFEEVSTLTTLLDDNFDGENPVYVPPNCGQGTTPIYAFGYNCYTECAGKIPGTQIQDPNPLPDVEGGLPQTTLYTSTKSVCLSCPAGQVNMPTQSLIPPMTSNLLPSGTVADDNASEGAWLAFDGDADTFWTAAAQASWLRYQFLIPKVVSVYEITASASPAAAPSTWILQGSSDGSTWVNLDTENSISWYAGEVKRFAITNTTAYAYYRILISFTSGLIPQIPAQISEIKLFALSVSQTCKTASATSFISQSDADSQATAAATALAQAELNCIYEYTSTQTASVTCPPRILGQPGATYTRSATAISLISQADADARALRQAILLLPACPI